MEDDQSIMDDSWKMTEDGEESEWYIEMKAKQAKKEAEDMRRAEGDFSLKSEDLSSDQERAVLLLCQGRGFKAVADELSISVSTLYRWRQNASFQHILGIMRGDLKRENQDAISTAVTRAITTLTELLDNEDATVRHNAARTVLTLLKEK